MTRAYVAPVSEAPIFWALLNGEHITNNSVWDMIFPLADWIYDD